MENAIKQTVVRFIEFVRLETWLSSDQKLSAFSTETLEKVLILAGFNPGQITIGKLLGNFMDQDGPTGEHFTINNVCPVKVVGAENKDDYLATGWLDSLVGLVVRRVKQHCPQDLLIEEVAEKIRQNQPLQPITLTSQGDQLIEATQTPPVLPSGYFVRHRRDTDSIFESPVGLHRYCNGWVDRHRATLRHDTLVCRACGLRVYIPIETETFGDLRQVLP